MRLVTADSTELNYLDTALPGTAVLNKAAVLGPAKNLDVLQLNANIATSSISTAVAPAGVNTISKSVTLITVTATGTSVVA